MTNDTKATGRQLDLTIDIDATLEEVWHALTTGEGIARWFGPYAAVTPGEGGSVSVGWDPKEMWDTPITVWEPLRHMQTASEMPSKDGRVVRLAVDYFLEAHDGRVRVRLVHSGFDDSDSWDGYIDGLDAGWTFFLFNLKHALERHRGVDRQQLSARFRTTARAGEDHPVFGAKGLRVQPSVSALRPTDACRLSLGGVEVDATGAGLLGNAFRRLEKLEEDSVVDKCTWVNPMIEKPDTTVTAAPLPRPSRSSVARAPADDAGGWPTSVVSRVPAYSTTNSARSVPR